MILIIFYNRKYFIILGKIVYKTTRFLLTTKGKLIIKLHKQGGLIPLIGKGSFCKIYKELKKY